jgi:hypothetical protein
VTNLTTASITQTSLTLNWNASVSTDVASYDVYNGATLLGNTTSTTYNVTGLSSGTNYTFTVKAKDASNNIASGTSVSTTTVPADVTNLTTASVTTTSLTLNWTASTGATSYDIYNGATLLGNTTSATYNVTGLTAATQYTFKVVAKNSSGSSTGVTTTVTTASASDTTPPNDVTNLAAGTATINSIPISWTLSSSNDVANYEVAYSSNGGTSYTVASNAVNASSTSYTINGLTAGTTYTIRVVAIDTSSNRSTGATITKATAASVSYTLSATPNAGTYNATQNVTLSTSPTGATLYYTTDGSTPTTSSSVYSTPIAVSSTTTIKFFAKDSVGNQSGVSTATYTIDTVAPSVSVSPAAGTYGSTQSVTLTGSDNSGTTPTIYYTTDGSTPATSSTVYSGAITVSATTTIKYLAVDGAGNQTTGSATYTIDTTAPDMTTVTAGTPTSNSIPISWATPTATDVAKYEVAYSSDGGTNYTIATSNLTAPATSYTVTGLTISTSYTIRVVSIDGVGNRSTPSTITKSTANLNPTNATLYLNSDDLAGQTLTNSGLTWQDRSGNGYNINLSLGWGTSITLDVNASGILNPGGGQINGSKLTSNLTQFQTSVFTWEFEFVCGNAATSAAYTLQNETGNNAFYIDINGAGAITFHGASAWWHQYTPSITLHDGNKHILQVISNGTTVKHYIDGTLQYTWTIGANSTTQLPSALTDVSLWFTANASTNASNGIGRLRRVRFYPTALSDADRETSRTTL